MGHIANPDRSYRLLQQRLDSKLTGAPDSPTFIKILKILFNPAEADIARQLPGTPTPLVKIAAKIGQPADKLNDRLRDMARRGLVIDMELKGQQYFSLPPVVIGFFEYTFMRTREDVPLKTLAKLFDEYMHVDDRFSRAIFQGTTQLGRALVHEEALLDDNLTEILDWERVSRIVANASAISVSLCACRHKAQHLGKACDNPQEVCLTLNMSAEIIARSGNGRLIDKNEALRILQTCKELGLMQTGENVQRNVSFICNCCSCCCGLLDAIRTFDLRQAIVTSNWQAFCEEENCNGCGLCVTACPVKAIDIVSDEFSGKKKARIEPTLCLGCGVCVSTCNRNAMRMVSRPQRVYTPETTFDKTIAMAIERGKLADQIFDDPEKLSHRALGRIIAVIERSRPFKATLAIKPLRSVFLNTLVKGAKRMMPDIEEAFG